MSPRVAIVGGGIAGLACAQAIRQARADVEVVVFEREAHVGGKARSDRRDGWVVERGPAGFLGGRAELDALVEAAGLRTDLVEASSEARRRFLWHHGTLREVAPHPVRFARSGILGATGLARALLEPLVPRHHGHEETVWGFAARRLGRQFADRLVSPMTLGVFAGDARRLSVDAAFPRMRALEREHGSLIRGLVARRGRMGGALTSFRDGMQQLPSALAARGAFTVRCGAPVQQVVPTDRGWDVGVRGAAEAVAADALVLAGEPWAMAPLLAPLSVALADDLRGIPYPAVLVVALGYRAAAAAVPRGFGALFPRGAGYRMLGTLWESSIFPGRAPDGHLLMRIMFGGAVDQDAARLADDALIALARSEVERLYGIGEEPVLAVAHRWPRAIPQYELGHLARVARIERAASAFRRLLLTGNGLRGVSFADAASDGMRTGAAVAATLAA